MRKAFSQQWQQIGEDEGERKIIQDRPWKKAEVGRAFGWGGMLLKSRVLEYQVLCIPSTKTR